MNGKQRRHLFFPVDAEQAPTHVTPSMARLSSVGSNWKIFKGVYWEYETKTGAALNGGKKKNPPKTPTFSQEFHVCSGYWRQFKTFPTFAITPCKHFPSSPESSAIGSQHSYVTWQTKKYFLPNQPSAALVRWLFPHFIPYNLQSLLLNVQTETANFLCYAS